jgi:hypothetical protein
MRAVNRAPRVLTAPTGREGHTALTRNIKNGYKFLFIIPEKRDLFDGKILK